MTTIVRFRALSGAGERGPVCYFVEVDGLRLLLDCGWDDAFRVEQLQQLAL